MSAFVLGVLVGGVFVGLLTAEILGWIDLVPKLLIRHSVRGLPDGARQRWSETLESELEAVGGRPLSALVWSVRVWMRRKRLALEIGGVEADANVDNHQSQSPAISPTISVVMTVLNEREHIETVFRRLPANVIEILVVDAGSGDDSAAHALSLSPLVRVIDAASTPYQKAVAMGLSSARGDLILTLNPSHAPTASDIERIVLTLRDGAQFVTASRFLRDPRSRQVGRARRGADSFLRVLTQILYGVQLTEIWSGTAGLWRRDIHKLGLDQDLATNRYGPTVPLALRAHVAGLVVREVACSADPVTGTSLWPLSDELGLLARRVRVLVRDVARRRAVRSAVIEY